MSDSRPCAGIYDREKDTFTCLPVTSHIVGGALVS